MTPDGAKIVTKLRDRRQIDAALRRLQEASSELELRRQVQALVERGPAVIPSLVGAMRRADARTLVLLGIVASHLDHGQTSEALFRVLQQPGRSYAERSAAVSILERFLDVPVPDDLRPGPDETIGVVVSALPELLERSEAEPAVLADAVEELDQQEPSVVLAVVAALHGMQGEPPLELLRMVAQDVRLEIAAAAVEALGSLRLPEAARALQTLASPSAAELRQRAEWLLRKQQLAGVEVAPLLPLSTAFRALVGPVDGEGQRRLWLIEETAGPMVRRMLELGLSDETGAVRAAVQQDVPKNSLPMRRLPGTWSLERMGRQEVLVAETGWDTARRLVLEALERNRETQIPLPGMLRLLGSWLWGVRTGGQAALPRVEPEREGERLAEQSRELAAHPAFLAWHPALEGSTAVVDQVQRRPARDREAWVGRLAAQLLAEPDAPRRLARRLRANGEWLALAGEAPLARVALAAAGAVEEGQAEDLPLWLALVERDLDAALEWMEPWGRSRGPKRDKGE